MKGIGIKRSSGIEIVDATLVDDAIIPSQCPGDLRISCTVCAHAWKAGAITITRKGRKGLPFPFIVCHWYDARPAGKPSSGSPS